jgi:8-oxo-dGTP pyrophosphatase MutT (NUDIX family)
MIFRNSKWDLPKGKLEAGENIQECAIREVEEECGVRNLQIVNQLQSTYHTYQLNCKAILKCTYWFKMITNYNDELVPQIKEGITKVAWVDINDISEKLENTYGNIKELLSRK